MDIIQKPLNHFDERRLPIDMIVIHATATDSLQQTFDILFGSQAPNRVSAHYVIDQDGTIYQLVPDDKRAWHAGVSYWQGVTDVNSRSIGIEFQCGYHAGAFESYPKVQIQAGLLLCQALMKKYPITVENVVRHSDIAPERKKDPGNSFPWEAFKKQL